MFQSKFLNRLSLHLRPDPARVVVRPFKPATEPRDLNPTDKTRANHIVSNVEVRRTIRVETTKIEAYNDFLDWVCFGGPIIKSGDPVGQEKQLKYASLVANTIMLSNVADLTGVLSSMASDGHSVTPGLVARLSPYMREHIRRFGQYVLDMDQLPAPLNPQPLPFENAL